MRSLALLAVLLLSGCLRHRSPPLLPSRGPARDSLIQLDRTRGDSVAAHGPVEGVLALLHPDVVYLRGRLPILYGREAARAVLAANAPAAGAVTVWQPLGGELSGDHQSAYSFGVAARSDGDGRLPLRLDRYIAFWRREPRSPWRISAYLEIGALATALSDSSFPPEQVTPPSPLRSRRQGDVIAKIRAADSAFSDMADRMGVAEAFATYAAGEGAIFNGSELVIGPRAIREFYNTQITSTALTWRTLFVDVAGSEDLGFSVGESVATLRGPSGAAVQRFGKYLTVWRRQRDGSWKFVIEGGSTTAIRTTERPPG